MAELRSGAGSTAHTSSTQNVPQDSNDSSSAVPDILYNSWEELQAASLLQLRPSTSSTSSRPASHSLRDADAAHWTAAEKKELVSPAGEQRLPAAAYPCHRAPFSQGVSLSLLELHDTGGSNVPPPARHALAASTAVCTARSGSGPDTAATGSVQEPHAHACTANFAAEPSVPVAKETVAAAFMSIDEELDDDLGGLQDVGLYAVPAAAQNAARTSDSATTSVAAVSKPQVAVETVEEVQLLTDDSQEELKQAVEEETEDELQVSLRFLTFRPSCPEIVAKSSSLRFFVLQPET